MVSPSKISGELEKDIGMLKGEIRRASAIFKDAKNRGIAVETEALEGRKSLDAAFRSMTQQRLNRQQFYEGVRMRLNATEQGLKGLAIEDTVFIQEVERAKSIIEQFKKVFPFKGENILHIAAAEASITLAEVYLTARLNACTSFIKNTFDPISKRLGTLDPKTLAAKTRSVYSLAYEFAKEINETTRQAMIAILQFYKQLYQKYPLLVKVLVREAWSPQIKSRVRMLE